MEEKSLDFFFHQVQRGVWVLPQVQRKVKKEFRNGSQDVFFILNFQEDSHLFRWEMNWKKFGY